MSELVPRRSHPVRKRDSSAVARVGGEDVRELLAFDVADESYALPLDAVREILKPPPVTPVPRAADDVLGVISVRGRITTVLDLRRRLRGGAGAVEKQSRILLVADGDEIVGLLVDRVLQVHRLGPDEIEVASVVAGDTSEFVVGIGRPRSARQARGERGERVSSSQASDILILLDHAELLRR